jgi:hypothetical protein
VGVGLGIGLPRLTFGRFLHNRHINHEMPRVSTQERPRAEVGGMG